MPATQRFSEPYYSASRSTFHHLTGHQLRIRGLPVLTRIGTFAAPGPYIKTTKRLVADLTTKPISRLARSMQIPSGSLRSPPPSPPWAGRDGEGRSGRPKAAVRRPVKRKGARGVRGVRGQSPRSVAFAVIPDAPRQGADGAFAVVRSGRNARTSLTNGSPFPVTTPALCAAMISKIGRLDRLAGRRN